MKGEILDVFAKLPAAINELVEEFSSAPVVGDLNVGITQYSFWFFVAAIVFLTIMFVFVKKQTIEPKGFFVNGVEYLIEYVQEDVAKGILGATWRTHFPFLATVFLFIMINNYIGLIPGMKTGTGAIGVTFALALVAFVYFIYYGCKAHGVIGYIKSIAPSGVSFPMNALVWVIEVFSLFLRLITLAVRLFCNMFAGHVVMGSFAIIASLFCAPAIEQVSAAAIAGAMPAVGAVVVLLVLYAVELIVAFVQAYVFTLLTAVYIQIAEGEH